jgi:hypothetical protein
VVEEVGKLLPKDFPRIILLWVCEIQILLPSYTLPSIPPSLRPSALRGFQTKRQRAEEKDNEEEGGGIKWRKVEWRGRGERGEGRGERGEGRGEKGEGRGEKGEGHTPGNHTEAVNSGCLPSHQTKRGQDICKCLL